LTAQRCASLADCLKTKGLEPIDGGKLPSTCDNLYVLVRSEKPTHIGTREETASPVTLSAAKGLSAGRRDSSLRSE
jgi:hypothetical protein